MVNKIFYFRKQSIKEHLGGVYEFLQSQKAETFRDIELKKKIVVEEKPKPVVALTENKQHQKDFKKLRKQISDSEKKITEIEATIAHVEFKLSKPELLSENESKEIYTHYEKYKQQLEEEMKRWAELAEQLEGSKVTN